MTTLEARLLRILARPISTSGLDSIQARRVQKIQAMASMRLRAARAKNV